MPDKLKDLFDAAMVRGVAADLKRAWPPLDERRFVRDALDGLDALELTPRGAHVAGVMRRHLPPDYAEAVRILVDSLGAPIDGSELFGFAVFRYLPHATFIGCYGLSHFEESMRAMHALTQRFTAEWSVRPFLIEHEEATLARLREWTRDPSAHVRRLVSEGTRPRLPWAMRLRAFQRDPAPVLELLELLRDDPERYVQRSVANNLNDIGKDHPALVVETCRRWLEQAPPGRAWIVRHALRSLVKGGDRGALALVGAGATPHVRIENVRLAPRRVRIGESLSFSFSLVSTRPDAQSLVVDYAVHFVKADGTRRAKVFKLRKLALAGDASATLAGRVSLAPMSTRTPYAGRHAIDVRVNGVDFPLGEFEVRR